MEKGINWWILINKKRILLFEDFIFFLLASIFGLIAFIFNKYEKLNEILIVANIAGLFLLVSIIGVLIKLKKN